MRTQRSLQADAQRVCANHGKAIALAHHRRNLLWATPEVLVRSRVR